VPLLYPVELAPEERTLGNRFGAAGYQTAYIGKWHLGWARSSSHPLLQGFDAFYGLLGGAVDYDTHRFGEILDWQRNGRPVHEPGYATTLLAEAAIEQLEARDRGRPFLLVVSFNAPHVPLSAPEPLVARYAEAFARSGRTRPSPVHAAAVDMLDRELGGRQEEDE